MKEIKIKDIVLFTIGAMEGYHKIGYTKAKAVKLANKLVKELESIYNLSKP